MKCKAKKASQRLKPPPPAVGRPKQKISIDHAVKLVSCIGAKRVAKHHRESTIVKFFSYPCLIFF
jgi:hypothetical protein